MNSWQVATETIERSGGQTPLNAAEEPYVLIPLDGQNGRGLAAKVSLCDASMVKRHKWYASANPDEKLHVYARTYIKLFKGEYRGIMMHRMILDLKSGELGDHIDGDTLDNRRSKIRKATWQENAQNRTRRQKNQVVQYAGVHRQPHDKGWKAFITIDYVHHYLGFYPTAEEAARIYDMAARYHFGVFAACNFEGSEAKSREEIKSEFDERAKAKFSSPYTGVHYQKNAGKWKARITFNAQRHVIGEYAAQEEAARAYDAAARYYIGPDAKTNFEGIEALSINELRRRIFRLAFERGEASSPYSNVYATKGKWASSIQLNGKRQFIGYFDSAVDAAKAYDACVRFHCSKGAFTNFEGDEAKSINAIRNSLIKGSSKYRGVFWHARSKKWIACVRIDGKRREINRFDSEIEAAKAFDSAAQYHQGPDAMTNFQGGEPKSLEELRPKVVGRRSKYHPMSASIFSGLTWRKAKGKWEVYLPKSLAKKSYVGSFRDELAAARAYDDALAAHGLPRVNFPPSSA